MFFEHFGISFTFFWFEMNKLWIFQVSAISWNLWLTEKKRFVPKGYLPEGHWQMGHGHISCHGGLDWVKIIWLTSRTHRSNSNPMIWCKLERSVVWNRTRGSGRVLWWWRRYPLVAGACFSELYCGAARWSMVTASYGDSYNSIRCAGDSVSHLGASKVIAGVIRRWRWPQPRHFWRACCKGKQQKSIDWDLPPSIQPSGRP
jgi:hypothetical protein